MALVKVLIVEENGAMRRLLISLLEGLAVAGHTNGRKTCFVVITLAAS
jgi:hypothetical protein